MKTAFEKDVIGRLQRLEARTVNGFGQLGVNVVDEADWFRVDLERRRIMLKYPGKTISAIWIAMRAAGCDHNVYELHIGGELVGGILLGAEK